MNAYIMAIMYYKAFLGGLNMYSQHSGKVKQEDYKFSLILGKLDI